MPRCVAKRCLAGGLTRTVFFARFSRVHRLQSSSSCAPAAFKMKAIRLVLIGLGSLVVAIVLWLQHDSTPTVAPQTRAAAMPGTPAKSEPRTTRADEQAEPAATPPGQDGPGKEAADSASPASVSLGQALGMPNGFEKLHLLEQLGFDAAAEGFASAIQTLAFITVPGDRAAFLRGIFVRAADGTPTAS